MELCEDEAWASFGKGTVCFGKYSGPWGVQQGQFWVTGSLDFKEPPNLTQP